ncbi:hypothetical protein ACFQ4C_08640 [Larkinella insperata]|uniref:Uncharacterized protein n=1 Tax=Larkinella insperata TaxID=332158 RepID=A0ABW3Q1E7_9BACT
MELLNLEMLNAGPLLADLRVKMQAFDLSEAVYLNRLVKDDSTNPLPTKPYNNTLGINKLALPGILHLLGIRSLTLNSQFDLANLAGLRVEIPAGVNERFLWRFLRNDTVIKELRLLFQACRIIAFDDWSRLAGASDLWDGLLRDVLKPIGMKEFEFIFYLGDPDNKLFFQVDEALDIISDFSRYGKVTFTLDESEAIKLWKVLNGVHSNAPFKNQPFPDLKRKYLSIFRTMNITRLLIYSTTAAILISNQEQFGLARQKVATSLEMAADARQYFVEGFSMGLMLHLDLATCLLLGLIVLGSQGEQGTQPDQNALTSYINRWIEDLQKPETMYLYQ